MTDKSCLWLHLSGERSRSSPFSLFLPFADQSILRCLIYTRSLIFPRCIAWFQTVKHDAIDLMLCLVYLPFIFFSSFTPFFFIHSQPSIDGTLVLFVTFLFLHFPLFFRFSFCFSKDHPPAICKQGCVEYGRQTVNILVATFWRYILLGLMLAPYWYYLLICVWSAMLPCLCWDLFAKYQWLGHYRVADEINGYVDDLLYMVRFVECVYFWYLWVWLDVYCSTVPGT